MAKKPNDKYASKSGLRFLSGINPQEAVKVADKMEPKKKKPKGKK